jgi:integrase
MYTCTRARLKCGKVKKLQKNLLFDLHEKNIALREEKIWKRRLLKEACKLDGKDLEFGEVLHRFYIAAKAGYVGRASLDTYKGHVNRIKRFCRPWMRVVSNEINRGDGKKMLLEAKNDGASVSLLRKIKMSVNLVYKWGIEERLILGIHNSPVFGIHVEEDNDEEKIPPILALEEVKLLLEAAKRENHSWYPIWALALLTGMRSGELFAL